MDLLNLFVRVGARDEASPAIDEISNSIIGKLGSAAKTAATALAALWAGNKVIEFGKQAFYAYQQFEQLEGGVAKLYGNAGQRIEEYAQSVGRSVDEVQDEYARNERAQELMMQNAQQAWRTAGMDANSYMQTATSFSAALINSLGGDTEEAAKLTDRAMTAISDNYNTFGSDMESVKNAFMGFSKQNYTMLDNLKLGYGGTKTEMERLIADANEWGAANGEAADLSIDSFADVVTAIERIQKKQGIYGTTQREALGTIEGSINATKAAWSNLVAEFGKPDADLGARVADMMTAIFGEGGKGGVLRNVTNEVKTIASNVVRAVSNAVGDAAEWLASNGASMFQKAIENSTKAIKAWASDLAKNPIDVMGSLFKDSDSDSGIFSRLAKMGTDIYETIREWMPDIQQSVSLIAETIWTTISNNAPAILEAIGNVFNGVAQWLIENGPEIVGWLAETVMSIREWIFEHAPEILDAIGNTIDGIINWLIENGPAILEAAGQMIANIGTAIVEHAPEILYHIGEMVGQIIGWLIDHAIDFFNAAVEWVQQLMDGSSEKGAELRQWFADLPQNLANALGDLGRLLWDAGTSIIQGLWDGLKAKWGEVTDWVSGIGSWIAEHKGPKAYDLGLLVPNGQWIMQGLGEGLQKGLPSVQGILSDVTDSIQTGINTNVSIADAKPSGNNAILAALGEIRDNMNMSVTLDSGALVGGIAPQMNTALGGIY